MTYLMNFHLFMKLNRTLQLFQRLFEGVYVIFLKIELHGIFHSMGLIEFQVKIEGGGLVFGLGELPSSMGFDLAIRNKGFEIVLLWIDG